MASLKWTGVSGDWTQAGDWTGGIAPGVGDDVTISGANPFTLTLYTAATVGNIVMNASGSLFYDAGVLNLGGTFALQAGTLALAFGSLSGGTLALTGGTLDAEGGTLNAIAVQGQLLLTDVNAALEVTNGLSMSGANGSGVGSIALTGNYARINFLGSQTLANAVVSFGSTGYGPDQAAAATLQVEGTSGASSGSTLTLAQNVWLQDTGTLGQIIIGGTLDGAHSDSLINQGTITAAVANSTLTVVGTGSFDNQGTISVSDGATLDIASASFTNTGTILLNSATLDFGGTLASSSLNNLGHISLTDATVRIDGDVINTGSTLAIGAGSTLGPLTLAGTITGGTVVDTGGGLSLSSGTGILSGVTYDGILALGAGDAVTLSNNTLLSAAGGGAGTANVSGSSASLFLQGQTTLNNAVIDLGSSTTTASLLTDDAWLASAATTATLGPQLIVRQTGAFGAIDASATTSFANYGQNGWELADTLINQGSITGGFAGGTLMLGGEGTFLNQGNISISNGDTLALGATTFINSGSILVNNASLEIDDSVSLTQLGNIQLNAASVDISGTLSGATGTLRVGTGNPWGQLTLTGVIDGGTILDAGQGLLATGNATLSDVTYRGNLDLSSAFEQLSVAGGITLSDATGTNPGTVTITGAGSCLLASDSETIANATIYLGSAITSYGGHSVPAAELAATANTTLTLASNTMLRSAGVAAALGDAVAGHWSDVIVNSGTILEATPVGTLTIGASLFINGGGLVVGNTGSVNFTGAQFNNIGTISITGGSTLGLSLSGYYAAPAHGATVFSNAGMVRMLGGSLNEDTDGGLLQAVPLQNTDLIQGFGTVSGPILNSGTIEAKYGPNLDVTGNITGSGTLLIDPGCVLEVGGIVAATQTVAFTSTGETLRLDQSQRFSGTIEGFVSGDAIDITGTPINTVAISAGTLVLGTGAGPVRLTDKARLGGEVSVGADAHGGKLATYTAQTSGSGGTGGGTVTVIPVAQPKMLFWASPFGDEFQGTAAMMNGATIANWAAADTLDFVDVLGTKTTVLYAQATGQGSITVTDGTHTATVNLVGSYNATWFHVSTDHNGGAVITYSAH